MSHSPLAIGQQATLACILEVTVPKPGNVHRSADFPDMTFQDFLLSAVAIGPAMQNAANVPLGQTVLDSVQATRTVVSTNTNLGLVLLLAPLAGMTRVDAVTSPHIGDLLSHTDADDCRMVYQAIRMAKPGGMGTAEAADLADTAPPSLVDAMALAADRDLIARQYANQFQDLFEFAVPALQEALEKYSFSDAVIQTHLKLMHEYPDTLIARKLGEEVANQAAALAGRVLKSGEPGDQTYLSELSDLDFWLRADGNRRNPGTTADMIGAALFVCLRRGTIRLPFETL